MNVNLKKKNHLVVQSNILIQGKQELTALQKKVILYLIAKIDPTDTKFRPYRLNAKDLVKGLGIKDTAIYTKLKQANKELMSKVYEIDNEHELTQINLFHRIKYFKGEGAVEFTFHPDLEPYLLQLRKQFTSVPLKQVLGMRSVHSIRIYEFLKQFHDYGQLTLSLEELKFRLSLAGKYKVYTIFKRRVIEQAQKELAQTDCAFTFEEIKKGRKVERIKFILQPVEKRNIPEDKVVLFQRLQEQFKLSPKQAKRIVLFVSTNEINQTLYEIQTAKVNGKINTNIAAFTIGVFKNKFPSLYPSENRYEPVIRLG